MFEAQSTPERAALSRTLWCSALRVPWPPLAPPLGTKPSFSLASDLRPEAQDNQSFSWAPKIVLSGRQKDLYFSMSSDFSFFVNIYISEN